MSDCKHHTQKRVGTMQIAVVEVRGVVMWCLYCGALKLGSDEWRLPVKPTDKPSDTPNLDFVAEQLEELNSRST